MAAPAQQFDASTLDEFLLDLAALIELSPFERRVTENRYRKLKDQVERFSSPLRPYLIDGESLIYAQGSVATSSTILSGDDDDRFDVDAIIEVDVPPVWSDSDPLDKLFVALQGFPGAKQITRCTRCVQIVFAFMHMDVTVMDRHARLAGKRPGQIFHSPDRGSAYRVYSNPWGFTDWFRSKVGNGDASFRRQLESARLAANRAARTSHLQLDEGERRAMDAAEQISLPPAIPSRIDAQEVVSLKLLKRFVNLRYLKSALRRPPSIWLTKLTAQIGYDPSGLSHQLFTLASAIASILRHHLKYGTVPQEENPAFPADKINDRWPRPWPEAQIDMKTLADHLDELTSALNEMSVSPQAVILKKIDQLFGERIGSAERIIIKERYDHRGGASGILVGSGAGSIFSTAVVQPRRDLQPVRQHHFHALRVPKLDENGEQ
jgi:hypothetical protein